MTSSGAPATVAVLGATGFIGSAVVRALRGGGVQVRAVARRPLELASGPGAPVDVRTADLTVPGAAAAAVDGADAVVLATLYSAGTGTWRITDGDTGAEQVNVGIARDLAAACAARAGAPKRIVFVGAASQAGPVEGAVLDGSEPDLPAGPYDRQKLAAERILLDADARGILRAASVRLPTVFGPPAAPTARDRGIVSAMARKALAGEPLTMWHDGTVRRDLLFVDDVAQAIAAAVEHTEVLAGRHWLLGTGVGRPLGPVFEQIAAAVAERTGRSPVPVASVPPPENAEAGDFGSITVDSAAFRAATGWTPATGFDRAVDATVGHLAAVHASEGAAGPARRGAQ